MVGDVVGSRDVPDRERAQRELAEALDRVNDLIEPRSPLRATIGDEFQGLYASLGGALRATLLLRLMLKGRVEVRFGVGWGPVQFFEGTATQDGPAWWGAREAIELVRGAEDSRGAPRGLRTMFVGRHAAQEATAEPGVLTPDLEDLVNAALIPRDELVSAMDERDARIALGIIEGKTNAAIGEEEGVSASAISQRALGAGIYAVIRAGRLLDRALMGEEEA